MGNKQYTRSEALEAMYELKRQGFKKICLNINEDGTLFLGCSWNTENTDSPKIDIDSVEDWTNDSTNKFKRNNVFWWIFD